MSSTFKPYLNQNYENIKAKCLKNGNLFKDDKFPANESSLYRIKPIQNVLWQRPKEICESPQFIVGRIEPNDLDQGDIGDCWLISACSVVASIPEYVNVVIPANQSFENDYAGIFRFRFWRFGEWIEVVVDDLLPVDENNSLIYCQNRKDTNEMFGPLLEKAYAKLNTCYEFLDGGDIVDAMIDMTGGIHERFNIKSKKADNGDDPIKRVDKTKLWDIIFKSYQMKSLLGASIEVSKNKKQEQVEANGLVLGHAYCILEAFELINNNGKYDELRKSIQENSPKNSVKLLRMRNPWGEQKSYTGKWTAKSPEWNQVSSEVKTTLNFQEQTNGQFFISFDDFVKNFDDLDLVHVNLNAFVGSDENSISNFKWIDKQFLGAWKKGINAGGCGNDNYDDFWLNPQFLISLTLQNNQDNKVSIIISLMQTEQNRKRAETNGTYEMSNEPINFSVFRVKDGTESKKKYAFSDLDEIYSYHTYMSEREITARLDLDPGNYVIIPSLFDKDVEMKFCLRVFIEGQVSNEINLKAVDLTRKKKSNEDKKNKDENQENETGEKIYAGKGKNKEVDEDVYYEEDYDEENEYEYEYEYEEFEAEEIPEEHKRNRRNYEKRILENVLGPGGQVVSRACLLM